MKSTINVSSQYLDGIIQELDNSKYFLLNLSTETSRTDLFNFALALGLKEGVSTSLNSSRALIRTSNEDVKPYFFVYKSIYYDKVLSLDESKIDDITDIDSVFDLVEKYANTGFGVLARIRKEFPEDELFTKWLLNKINEMYKEYGAQYDIKSIYTE